MLNKKGGLALIIASKAKPMKDDESDGEADQQALKDCAQDILSAIKDEDADALVDALGCFVDLCGCGGDDEDGCPSCGK